MEVSQGCRGESDSPRSFRAQMEVSCCVTGFSFELRIAPGADGGFYEEFYGEKGPL